LSPWRNLDDVMRLLIVDDDELDRLAIRRCLDQANVRSIVDELTSGAEVVERARAVPYDCIILDHSLPGEDGADLIRSLIRTLQAAGVTTPILVVSGQDEEVGAELVAAGATDFLRKEDLTPRSLLRRLGYVQRLARAERQAAKARREAESMQRLTQVVLQHLPTGVVVVDSRSGAITMSNPAAEIVFGPGCQALKDQAASQVAPLLASALQEGHSVTAEQPLVHGGRRYRVAATPVIPDGSGEPSGGIVVTLDDVTEELAAREAAERGERARQEVLMIVSHDLRGPLSAIQVALDGLVDESSTQEERVRYGGAVTRSVQRADRLVRDLMVAAQLEAGTLRMELSKVSSRALLEQALRDNELLATGAKVALVLGPIDEVDLKIDRERLLQAIGNLVQNALRHGRGTPEITLSARRAGAVLELVTRDRGPGVAADAMPRLFEPFWQGNQKRGGAGLGLAIVRGIARAHGGEVRAVRPEDGGAEFVISLPLAS
jgi:signal transduction histidine kinase/DNA-binding response OmpR family regulator